jgi:MurNAc alpha-1-phosphate uridylyltransferase
MVLAAGRGERMRPLTDRKPKPLLDVGGKPLIEWHLEALAAAGIANVVINVSWLGEAICEALGDGSRWGLRIIYSQEHHPALETGGGIFKALPLLGEKPFLVINGDIWMDLDLTQIRPVGDCLAHLVMVPDPEHNPDGDFYLAGHRLANSPGGERLTYSGVGIYHPGLFAACRPGRFPLAPLLTGAIAKGQVTGQKFDGQWLDIGTIERLESLRRALHRQDPAS